MLYDVADLLKSRSSFLFTNHFTKKPIASLVGCVSHSNACAKWHRFSRQIFRSKEFHYILRSWQSRWINCTLNNSILENSRFVKDLPVLSSGQHCRSTYHHDVIVDYDPLVSDIMSFFWFTQSNLHFHLHTTMLIMGATIFCHQGSNIVVVEEERRGLHSLDSLEWSFYQLYQHLSS